MEFLGIVTFANLVLFQIRTKSQSFPLNENSGDRRKLIRDHGNISYLYIQYNMFIMQTPMLMFHKLKEKRNSVQWKYSALL